jgi:hypothetical protein
MCGQDHFVEFFGAVVGVDAHAGGCRAEVALDTADWCVQALVGDGRRDLVDIVARAALDRPPLRAVADLHQPMVVAEADHRGHGELQHLVGRATPDAAEHGQEVPVPELVR